jgi:SAM-dependent methyltransferase
MKAIDRFLQRWRIRKARRFIAPGSRVLDIGCADGALFRQIPEIGEGVGVDPDLPSPAPTLPHTHLFRGLFPHALPDDRPFDVITLLAVLEHVPAESQRILAADCARYLVPGGHLVITVPAPFVDHILAVLRTLRLIHGMALEEHYGYDPRQTPTVFAVGGLELFQARRFQLGLNNLFVFKKTAVPQAPPTAPPVTASDAVNAPEFVSSGH